MLTYHPRNIRMRHLEDCLSQETDACIEWPFSSAGGGGGNSYGCVIFEGRHTYAHRVVCELTYGPPQGLHAAHRCGNSKCVNKRHLRWATPAENASDKLLHGTNNDGEKHGLSKLSNEEAASVRRLALAGVKQIELARRFAVSPMAISRCVRGHSYRRAA